ncbi:unnamed protein product [Adineta ricciae]|uniref:RING-type domain-containing protein n=1 Tax=Adineta ricciae TaxID=249248 RepID=A0A814FNF9_ADIRI|nr:unnamed protein product [Adineta ricciae]
MEEEHRSINNNNDITSDARRLTIRRNLLRQTTTSRSSPYDSTLSNLERQRRRQILPSISNLITNLENPIEQENIELSPENDEYEVILELTDTLPIEETLAGGDILLLFTLVFHLFCLLFKENDISHQEQDESYQSLSTLDSELIDDDDDVVDNRSRFYYTSTNIPVYDYSSLTDPLLNQNHPLDFSTHEYHQIYSPTIDNDEDLSIEIILETSQNHSSSPIPRRQRSIIPSNVRANRGLRSSDILSIPQKLYSSLKDQFDRENNYSSFIINTQCYICLEDFQSIDSIKILNCQHVFHNDCINEWLRHHSNCAYCRTPVFIDVLRSRTERRQRARARRPISRSSPNNSIQRTSSESPILEQE